MAYKFGTRSREKLDTCCKELQDIMNEAIKYFDITILEGHRGKDLQNLYYEQGKSKLKYPQSKHNTYPSKAVDIAPWFSEKPHIRWNNREQFVYMAGIIKGIASNMGYKIRWGGDWDSDNDLQDQTFFDLPHFEIVE